MAEKVHGFSADDSERIGTTVRRVEADFQNSLPLATGLGSGGPLAVGEVASLTDSDGAVTVKFLRGPTKGEEKQRDSEERICFNRLIGLNIGATVLLSFFGGQWEVIAFDYKTVQNYDGDVVQAFGQTNGTGDWFTIDECEPLEEGGTVVV